MVATDVACGIWWTSFHQGAMADQGAALLHAAPGDVDKEAAGRRLTQEAIAGLQGLVAGCGAGLPGCPVWRQALAAKALCREGVRV